MRASVQVKSKKDMVYGVWYLCEARALHLHRQRQRQD